MSYLLNAAKEAVYFGRFIHLSDLCVKAFWMLGTVQYQKINIYHLVINIYFLTKEIRLNGA